MKTLLKKGQIQRTEKNEACELIKFVDSVSTQSHTIEFWQVDIETVWPDKTFTRKNITRQFVIPKEFYDTDDIDMQEVRKFRFSKSIEVAINLATQLQMNVYIYRQGAAFIVTENVRDFEEGQLVFVLIYGLLTQS
jgi:hypothetical protein